MPGALPIASAIASPIVLLSKAIAPEELGASPLPNLTRHFLLFNSKKFLRKNYIKRMTFHN